MSADRLKVSAGLLLTSPFVPMLFQGEEWGASTPWQYFTDFDDPELGRAVTEGRRSEFAYFGWEPSAVPDPQDPATFARSRLDWSELDKEVHADLLAWYHRLLRLRQELPDLTDPRLERTATSVDSQVGGLVVNRGAVIVVALLGDRPAAVEVGRDRKLAAASCDRIAWRDDRLRMATDSLAILIPAETAGERRHGRRSATPPPTIGAPTLRWTPDPGP
jgi:maltooligosyltrehalose trehalohydrolase